MANYKAMYFQLFNDVTDAIEKLKEAQRKAEEIYADTDEESDDTQSDAVISR